MVKEKKITIDHRWKGKLTVIDNTPVGVCVRCGERYFSGVVMHQLDQIAKGGVGIIRRIIVPQADFAQAKAA